MERGSTPNAREQEVGAFTTCRLSISQPDVQRRATTRNAVETELNPRGCDLMSKAESTPRTFIAVPAFCDFISIAIDRFFSRTTT